VTPNRRARIAGVIAAIAAVPFILPTAASATATFGQSNERTKPPAPGECAGYLWQAKSNHGDLPMLSKSNPRIVIPGLVKPAGDVDVTEVITYDVRFGFEDRDNDDNDDDDYKGYKDRGDDDDRDNDDNDDDDNDGNDHDDLSLHSNDENGSAEKYEMMRIEYYKGNTLLGYSPNITPDLQDDKRFAWLSTPLGHTILTEDADRVELVHASQFMKTDGKQNRFFPIAVCFEWAPVSAATTVTPAIDCNKAVLTLTNNGNKAASLQAYVNGETYDHNLAANGGSYNKVIDIAEDSWTDLVITDLDTDSVLWSKRWYTDCVTTSTPVDQVEQVSTPTTVPTQVLGLQVTAPEQPVLAFTGSQAATNTAIGAALLGLGAGLMMIGRRRKTVEA
jgi:hypothetical protein